jgi:hypothetical protein
MELVLEQIILVFIFMELEVLLLHQLLAFQQVQQHLVQVQIILQILLEMLKFIFQITLHLITNQ